MNSNATSTVEVRTLLIMNVLLLGVVLAFLVSSCRSTAGTTAGDRPLRAPAIEIVDPKGIVRVRIAGDLPDAMLRGKRVPRGEKAAGILIYDDSGQERGGYVTFYPSRNAALTLDPRDEAGQTVLLVAAPRGGSALTLTQGKDIVELRVDDETGPSIHAVRDNTVAFHAPPSSGFERTDGCRELRGALKSSSRDQVLGFCRARVSEEACQSCLGFQGGQKP